MQTKASRIPLRNQSPGTLLSYLLVDSSPQSEAGSASIFFDELNAY